MVRVFGSVCVFGSACISGPACTFRAARIATFVRRSCIRASVTLGMRGRSIMHSLLVSRRVERVRPASGTHRVMTVEIASPARGSDCRVAVIFGS